MDPIKLAELLREAVRGGLPGLPYWALLFLFLTVATGLGAFLGSYLRQRGTNLATRADYQNLLAELKTNTEATERIKATIAKEEWTEKEAITLRRIKLEAMMEDVHKLPDWVRHCYNFYLFSREGLPPNANPLSRARMLASFYFPELRSHLHEVDVAADACLMELMALSMQIEKEKSDPSRRQNLLEEAVFRQRDLYAPILAKRSELQAAADTVMQELLVVNRTSR